MNPRLAALFLVASLCSGCVYVSVPGKFTYIAPAFGTKNIEKVHLGDGMILEGYRSEQSQMAEAVAAGVAKGLKP